MQHQLYYRLCPPRKKFTRVITAVAAFHVPPGEEPTRIDNGKLVPHGLSEVEADDFRWNLEVTDNQLLESLRISRLPSEAELNAFILGDIDEEQFQKVLKDKRAALPSKRQLLADINRQRAAQGIKPPRRLQGQRNRSVSWRWVELLDIAAFKVKRKFKDTDTERQTKRRARIMARNLLPHYLQALEEFENSPRRPKEKVRPKPLLAREG